MPQTILLIVNDSADAAAFQGALTGSSDGPFKVEWLGNCSEAVERLAREGEQEKRGVEAIAAVLVDLFLSDSQGIETFNRLYLAAPQIPILILSTLEDEAVARQALQQGAQDYLLKAHLNAYTLPKALASMLERAAISEALFDEKERAKVTLDSIGDAVISVDTECRVTYLNPVAERMTGWSQQEAAGLPVEDVFRVVDADTRAAAANPMQRAIKENHTVDLAGNCLLIRRDGFEAPIEDSVAPIHDRRGNATGAVMVFHDVTAARKQAVRMTHLAQHDALTDLPNRNLLNDRAQQVIALANRHRHKVALLFLDVDRFKHINDSLGHLMGDRLLQSIAERLLACVRSSDTVSRQGGDEFVILLSDVTTAHDAAVLADKVLLALCTPHRIDGHDLHVTVSVGIALYPENGTDVATVMKNADAAMYLAKHRGRNNYQFFKDDGGSSAVERQLMESDLRHAIERHEFVLHYQPKITLATGTIIGAEALIRWTHRRFGPVPPAQFIPIAEACGLIVPISRWVLREACRQAVAWQDAGWPAICMAVNVSTVDLRARGFVAAVQEILAETGLAAHCLELEMTETFLSEDSKSTTAVLQALTEMGVHLALDDFGTGYSSLSHLKRFPIHGLKIDQSFVRDLATDDDDASIVTAVIGMGRSLNLQVVAEGVETSEQLAFLREHGCPQGQGHYFSRAVPARQFAAMLMAPEMALA